MAGSAISFDKETTADPAGEAATEEELARAKRSLAQFFGYHQGPNPRPGARVRIKHESGTVLGHSIAAEVYVLMDNGTRRLRYRNEVVPDGSPRLRLAEFLRLCGEKAISSGDSVCLVQLANHFKGVNGTQYANRAAHLWSIYALCLEGMLGEETPKLAEWLNKEILSEAGLATLPPILGDDEIEACGRRPKHLESTPHPLAKVIDAAQHALDLGQQSIASAEADAPQALDLEGLERHLAIDIANDQQIVILGRAVATPQNGLVDVIDLDSLNSYTLHTSGLDLSTDAMDPGWFWDVLTQSAIKNPSGTTAGWLASGLTGPDGADADTEARRRVALFGALISVRHAVIGKSEASAKRLFKRARDLHKLLDKVERSKVAAIAPELVASQLNTKIRLRSFDTLLPHMRAAVETMLQELPPPETKEAERPVEASRSEISEVAPEEPFGATAANPLTGVELSGHKKVSFAKPLQPLRFNITDHLLLTMEWQLVDESQSFDNAVQTALDWLEQRMGTSLPKHWREGAHEIELAGVSLQIESAKKLFAFRLEHPDVEHPTRWWRVEVTVLVGRSGSGGMVGLRMQVRDLVDLPPPGVTVPALVRHWAAKPGLIIAGARAGQSARIKTNSQFDRLNRIIRKRDRPSPVWVVPYGGTRLSQQGPLGGLARVLVVDPALREYASRYGELDQTTIHVFAPRTNRPTPVSTAEPGWQDRLRLLTLEMLQNPLTPSFRDVRDAIHSHRSASRLTQAPFPTSPVVHGELVAVEATELVQSPSHPDVEEPQGALVSSKEGASEALSDFPNDDNVVTESLPDDDDQDAGPSLEDIQALVRRETREYQELLELAESERDEFKQELLDARTRISSLQWRIQCLEDGVKNGRANPSEGVAAPSHLSELQAWAQTIAPHVVIADKALRVATRTEHSEVPKIYASLQALRDLYWIAKFGESDAREEANERWRTFLLQNRMTFSPVGKAAETSRYEDEYKAIVGGITYTAKLHISGNSAHDPMRCLRIYLAEDRENERIVVIHLPTHLTNSLT